MKIALLIVYLLFLIYTVVRILLDTTSTPKTLAYLLLVMVFPVAGILLYFSFGINYRHQQSTSKGALAQLTLDAAYQKEISNQTGDVLEMHQKEVAHFAPIVHFLGGISNEH